MDLSEASGCLQSTRLKLRDCRGGSPLLSSLLVLGGRPLTTAAPLTRSLWELRTPAPLRPLRWPRQVTELLTEVAEANKQVLMELHT